MMFAEGLSAVYPAVAVLPTLIPKVFRGAGQLSWTIN